MIELTWLAGPIGLVGLAIALVLLRRNGPAGAAQAPGVGAADLFLKQSPIIGGVVVLLGALIWVTVALPTALAFVGGAVLTTVVAFLAAKAVDDGALPGGSSSQPQTEPAPRRPLPEAFAIGLVVGSVGLLSIGLLYVALVHAPAAFLQSELVDFGNIAGGLALGVSIVALLLTVIGGSFAGAPGAAGERERGEKGTLRRLGAAGGLVGSANDLLQSYLCASVAAIVIAGAGTIFSGQRVEAVALPILIGASGLIASLVATAGAGALKGANPARVLRTVGLLATGIFLVLSYFLVIALEMEGQDPFTGRDYLLSGPFWAILAGSLAALGAGFATEFYTSWRPARRLAEGSGMGLGPTILWGFALGLESVLIPAILIAATTVFAYFFAGAYGVAMAALGALATVGIIAGTAAFGPLVASSEAGGELSVRGEPLSTAIAWGAVAESAEAIAKGVSVTASALTSLALLVGYSYATGLWGIGIDLQSPLLLSGLLIGAAIPLVTAALVLGNGRRAGTGPDTVQQADASQLTRGARLSRKVVLPLLLAIALPPLCGYLLGVHSVAGVIAGGTLSSMLLGLFLANSGSALVIAGIFVAANATAPEVHHVGNASGDIGRALREGGSVAVTVVIKLIGILSIVLVPWFIRVL